MTTGSLQKWIIEAEIMPKQGVNDPQGEAVMSGLKSLAFAETNRVRVGKLIRVEIEAEDEDQALARGTDMCEKLLANPVIEEYVVSAARIG
jgi:phosphoribosylformylglycinamidine synthase